MIEVFILGLLVSLVKLGAMARVVPGIGLWSFGALLFAIAAAVASFDARVIWSRYDPSLPGTDDQNRSRSSHAAAPAP
jgi:paraquat-inducible protein A